VSEALVARRPAVPARGDAEAIAAAVADVVGVVRLSPGPRGDIRTHLAGRRVDGVRLRPTGVEVHVVVEAGVRSLPSVATAVRRAVQAAFPGSCVDVVIDDLARPEGWGVDGAAGS
jgi:hypothetical protein